MMCAAPLPQPTISVEPSSRVLRGHILSGDYGTLCVSDDVVRIEAARGAHVPEITQRMDGTGGRAQLALTLVQCERELCALSSDVGLWARSGHQQSRGTPRCASACAVRAACGRCRRRHVVCCPAPAQLDALAQQEAQKKVMLERFQEEHPGFDFSGAEFNGMAPDPRTFMGGVKY